MGDDWAEDHHDVELVDEDGRRLARRRLPEGLEGITRLHALTAEQMPPEWAELEPGQAAAKVRIGIETWDRSRQMLRLRSALREFFPAALHAFDDLTASDALELLARAPDPDRSARLSRSQIAAALRRANRRDVNAKATDLQDVEPTPYAISKQCLDAVDDYGDVTLVPLRDESWGTSVSQWQGDRWGCLIDLWTEQEGRSDLVLDVDVFEQGSGYRFSVHLLYVP